MVSFFIAAGGCTFTHKFGPYSGQVVDAETGEPIEGAVVLIGFHTKSSSVGGWVHRFADAFEVLTDTNGEFRLYPKRVTSFRAMSIWDKHCDVTIFKPGYGVYPGNKKAFGEPSYSPSWSLPEGIHVTFHLPKLLTIKEKIINLHLIMEPAGIKPEKMELLRKLENQERINVGLSPKNGIMEN